MKDKFVLDLTDQEILTEVSAYLGRPVSFPKEKIGWLTEHPEVFTTNGIDINVAKLNSLYDSEPYISSYIIVSAITSLRRRPSDLFALIRRQKPGNKVLEFGCGSSTHGIACAQRGCEVTIVDVSPKMLNWATSRYASRGLNVKVHPIDKELPKKYFDTVICSDVLEHVPNPGAVLKRFVQAMKIGAVVHLHVALVPNLAKGHLPVAIRGWKKVCVPMLQKSFKKDSKHNYILVK
jgi:SAM-dependent methyltransferase